ncbi:MAG: 3'-5' exonuclease [bacterium]|nr:3'-5' exonuclease [bacterium]
MEKPKFIAFTDLEMTGLNPLEHEVIEIGAIIADIETLEEVARVNIKVKPEHIETATTEALKVNGYKEEDWEDALSLKESLEQYAEAAQDSIFAAWNTPFDWTFLQAAFTSTGITNPLDYHTIDVFTASYEKLHGTPDINYHKLSGVCEYFEIPKEPYPHRAVNGAERAYEVYKKLREL